MAVQAACTRSQSLVGGWGPGHVRAGRTENMRYPSVTSDVSKLSDWLNDVAPCRVKGVGRRPVQFQKGVHGEGQTEGWGSGHAGSVRRT